MPQNNKNNQQTESIEQEALDFIKNNKDLLAKEANKLGKKVAYKIAKKILTRRAAYLIPAVGEVMMMYDLAADVGEATEKFEKKLEEWWNKHSK